MYRDLLPIGTVVLLKGGEKRLMICGRVSCRGDENRIYDYVGCYFPEGIIDSTTLFFFDQDAIEGVYFIGCQDQEELKFRDTVLAELDRGKLSIKDGQIVIEESAE